MDPGGPIADELQDLWWILLGLGVAVYVLFLVLVAVPILRRRGAADQTDDEDVRGEVPAAVTKRWIVAGGVGLPAVLLPAALAFSVATTRDIPESAPPEGAVIEVIGHQWWWEVRYPDERVTTANEIHIPVGEPVELRLTSADVIHSFWVPELAGKVDALPDGTNTLVIEADEPGEYGGQCAEFCGLQHAKMGLLVIAQPRASFAAWLAEQREAAGRPSTDLARQGQAVFRGAECASCHVVRGTTDPDVERDDEAPDLTHFASRRTLAAGVLENTSSALREWLLDPDAVKEGTDMPAVDLTDDQLEALLAYLQSLE